jgi:hypothetical protein
MAGLVPAIHVKPLNYAWYLQATVRLLAQPLKLMGKLAALHIGVDGRDKPGHDGGVRFGCFARFPYPIYSAFQKSRNHDFQKFS